MGLSCSAANDGFVPRSLSDHHDVSPGFQRTLQGLSSAAAYVDSPILPLPGLAERYCLRCPIDHVRPVPARLPGLSSIGAHTGCIIRAIPDQADQLRGLQTRLPGLSCVTAHGGILPPPAGFSGLSSTVERSGTVQNILPACPSIVDVGNIPRLLIVPSNTATNNQHHLTNRTSIVDHENPPGCVALPPSNRLIRGGSR